MNFTRRKKHFRNRKRLKQKDKRTRPWDNLVVLSQKGYVSSKPYHSVISVLVRGCPGLATSFLDITKNIHPFQFRGLFWDLNSLSVEVWEMSEYLVLIFCVQVS